MRFFLFDGIRKEAPGLDYVSADPVTAGCRVVKSPGELALMQRANDITLVAYRATAATVHEGMTQSEFAGNCEAAFAALGVDGGCFVSFGKYTAFPHGISKPQALQPGDVILMDGGCTVENYASDITRTFVFANQRSDSATCGTSNERLRTPRWLPQKSEFRAKRWTPPRERSSRMRVRTGVKVPGLPHRTDTASALMARMDVSGPRKQNAAGSRHVLQR